MEADGCCEYGEYDPPTLSPVAYPKFVLLPIKLKSYLTLYVVAGLLPNVIFPPVVVICLFSF